MEVDDIVVRDAVRVIAETERSFVRSKEALDRTVFTSGRRWSCVLLGESGPGARSWTRARSAITVTRMVVIDRKARCIVSFPSFDSWQRSKTVVYSSGAGKQAMSITW